jgi:hypothetical protein
MATKKKNKNDAAAKAKRQTVIAGVGGVVLLGLLAFQVPRTMKMLNPPNAGGGTSAATTAAAPAATTPLAPPSLDGSAPVAGAVRGGGSGGGGGNRYGSRGRY